MPLAITASLPPSAEETRRPQYWFGALLEIQDVPELVEV